MLMMNSRLAPRCFCGLQERLDCKATSFAPAASSLAARWPSSGLVVSARAPDNNGPGDFTVLPVVRNGLRPGWSLRLRRREAARVPAFCDAADAASTGAAQERPDVYFDAGDLTFPVSAPDDVPEVVLELQLLNDMMAPAGVGATPGAEYREPLIAVITRDNTPRIVRAPERSAPWRLPRCLSLL